MSISLDGFVAGPSQSRENPLGVGGMQLHGWHLGEVADEADLIAQSWLLRPRGAYVMGRNRRRQIGTASRCGAALRDGPFVWEGPFVVSYDPGAWSDLFVGVAGASAALTGLVFVSVSINIERILKLPGVPSRALATLLLLLGVLVVSILGLAPGQSHSALGVELLGVGLLDTAAVGVFTWRSRPHGGPASWTISRLAVVGAGTMPFVIGGASILAERGGGLHWVLAGIVFAIIGGVMNAWVLLVEILR